MEIRYLKKMQKTPVIDNEDNEGISYELIIKIENEIGKKFPLAFKEFLLIGGKSANMLADMNAAICSDDNDDDPYWKEQQAYCKAQVKEDNQDLKKDYWAFADLHGGEQFHYFYFDEGDDPPVYYYSAYHLDDDGKEYAGFKKISSSFSEYINQLIVERKRNGY